MTVRGRVHRRHVLCVIPALAGVVVAAVAFAPFPPAQAHSAQAPYLDGGNGECEQWKIRFLDLGLTEVDFEVAEEGWVWVDRARRMQSASGVATKSKVAHNDTPANHYSHDWNVDLRVDPGQEFLLSDVNGRDLASSNPTKIELEWETGITPTQTSGADDDPTFPSWATPNVGDRVWTNGHWVFDCGHSTTVATPIPDEDDPSSCPEGTQAAGLPSAGGGYDYTHCADLHFPSEIHPGRAIASMRNQSATLPGSGTTPVPVTATDLYVHGRGGFMVQQLHCGIGIILDGESCSTATTDIADRYEFDICLPPKPAPQATLQWSVTGGPGNTLAGDPQIDVVDAVGGCDAPPDDYGNDFDDGTMLRVVVDLRGSGATPQDVYARHINAGWVFPTPQPLRHLQLRLDQMDLHQDHEAPGFNGELSFLWMAVNRAPHHEWHRLVHFDVPTYDDGGPACFAHTNHLNDYDDDGSCGKGLLDFVGPTYDFYLRPGQPFTVSSRGFEQDCYDENFGDGDFSLLDYVECHGGDPTEYEDWGNNDKLADVEATYGADVAPGRYEPSAYDEDFNREFELEFLVSEVALTDEDTADLDVVKECTHPGEVALAGEPFTCSVTVTNRGPGLPRAVALTDQLVTALAPEQYTIGTPVATVGSNSAPVPCSAVSAAGAFDCDIGTIPVGATATMSVPITPHAPGRFENTATASTASTDPDGTNDVASAVVEAYLPVEIDVKPVDPVSTLTPRGHGSLPVAVLTTPTFDAATVDVASSCFGDADAPQERDCSETHGRGHPTDVDKDDDVDMALHYGTAETGIDSGDMWACLIGRTRSGTGIYGCDAIRAL